MGHKARDLLDMYRNSHESVARYSVFLDHGFCSKKPRSIIDFGLTYKDARQKADDLNAKRPRPSFGGEMYGIQLENEDAANAALRKASKRFWSEHQAMAQGL